jgi:GTP diphosphokinase / guanosine-3',5'-bis(diphosphate) 3'-diphosphatase
MCGATPARTTPSSTSPGGLGGLSGPPIVAQRLVRARPACDKPAMVGPGNPALADVIRALAFAADKHRRQRRKDSEASPYINHPIDLANILANEAHVVDPLVLVAAILHDTVEDTDTTPDELAAHFGPEIRALVAEVTDDRTLPRDERKRRQEVHAPRASFRAQQVKLADKISNVRDLVNRPPATWDLERRRAYFDWCKRVVDGVRGRHAELEALFDAAYRDRP